MHGHPFLQSLRLGIIISELQVGDHGFANAEGTRMVFRVSAFIRSMNVLDRVGNILQNYRTISVK